MLLVNRHLQSETEISNANQNSLVKNASAAVDNSATQQSSVSQSNLMKLDKSQLTQIIQDLAKN